MLLHKLLKTLKASPVFATHHSSSEYLSSFFVVASGELTPEVWELSFYDSGDDRSIIYHIDPDKGTVERTEGKVFKQSSSTVHPLLLDRVMVDFAQALAAARQLQQKVYTAHPPSKAIFVLQDLGAGPLWNITFITQTFHVLNIKVDAVTGAILSHELSTVFQWKQ